MQCWRTVNDKPGRRMGVFLQSGRGSIGINEEPRKKHSGLEYSNKETRPEWLALSLSDGVREVMG